MPVPDYQSFMRPLLVAASDGEVWMVRDLYARLASDFALSEADLAEMLPSGRQATYANRIGWAKTYLLKAGALSSPSRGTVTITDRGRNLLAQRPNTVSTRDLLAFPEFQQFQAGGEPADSTVTVVPDAAQPTLSPEEQLEALSATLDHALVKELQTQIQTVSAQQFERLVVAVLVAMGYGGSARDAGMAIGKSGDNGIDGLIKQDPLGLDRVYIQAKKWQNPVHSPEIRTFAGSLTYHRASKGFFITTAAFSDGAMKTAAQIGNIILIDGATLARLMIDYGVGVITRETYRVRRVDVEYFDEL
ncbi:restriction endonuclease [Deinococcus sp. AB2017081]|uniref:restriction endonuclease n=1 Tax=Deinococcus sp. AB2017081 TaxID=3093660 RepID=UPI002ACC2A04|nr:restriction endonuclease [Deinococcus sp. AB2017081]WQE94473.1 restriction endonuclease [Deinococcus sp. AB2017081]